MYLTSKMSLQTNEIKTTVAPINKYINGLPLSQQEHQR